MKLDSAGVSSTLFRSLQQTLKQSSDSSEVRGQERQAQPSQLGPYNGNSDFTPSGKSDLHGGYRGGSGGSNGCDPDYQRCFAPNV